MIPRAHTQCFNCLHWRSPLDTGQPDGPQTCAAFPKGIPDDVWFGVVDHRQPHAGDHGVRWESKDGSKFPAGAVLNDPTMGRSVAELGATLDRSNPYHDKDGKFSSGHGGGAGAGGGPVADNIEADKFGNSREDGVWYDEDGISMTDSYVDQYGLPVTHAGFAGDSGGRYSVVLSERGDLHIMRERDPGPKSDALYTRDAKDVRASGLDSHAARSLGTDLNATSAHSSWDNPDRPQDEGGDFGGTTFGVGHTRTNQATGLTSGPEGAVTISGLGAKGGDLKLYEGDVYDFSSALDVMADARDEFLASGTVRAAQDLSKRATKQPRRR